DEVNSEWLLRGSGEIIDYSKKSQSSKEQRGKRGTVRNLKVSVERRVYEILDMMRLKGAADTEVEELGELVTHLIKENEEQKLKILDLYEKNAGMVDVLRKKLDVNI
ncbi:MAG: hypothetical protein AAGA85_22200, partial [Bacteroidota bacterium]